MQQEKSREAILNHLEQKAGDYEELYGSCAQGTLLALQEEFQMGNVETLKAATAMPGMALRGETCGAVIGAIMALGMAFGRSFNLADPNELMEFARADASKKCRAPAQRAARIAGGLILDGREKT